MFGPPPAVPPSPPPTPPSPPEIFEPRHATEDSLEGGSEVAAPSPLTATGLYPTVPAAAPSTGAPVPMGPVSTSPAEQANEQWLKCSKLSMHLCVLHSSIEALLDLVRLSRCDYEAKRLATGISVSQAAIAEGRSLRDRADATYSSLSEAALEGARLTSAADEDGVKAVLLRTRVELYNDKLGHLAKRVSSTCEAIILAAAKTSERYPVTRTTPIDVASSRATNDPAVGLGSCTREEAAPSTAGSSATPQGAPLSLIHI